MREKNKERGKEKKTEVEKFCSLFDHSLSIFSSSLSSPLQLVYSRSRVLGNDSYPCSYRVLSNAKKESIEERQRETPPFAMARRARSAAASPLLLVVVVAFMLLLSSSRCYAARTAVLQVRASFFFFLSVLSFYRMRARKLSSAPSVVARYAVLPWTIYAQCQRRRQ